MKKMNLYKEVLYRCLIVFFGISVTGGFMQIIAPPVPDMATLMGLGFFAMAYVLAVVIWFLRISVRNDKFAAACENADTCLW